MGFLQATLDTFRNDKDWNTLERDGTHRFDKEIAWIEEMANEYAAALGMDADKVMEIAEKNRHYSWANYYQKANFPGVNADSVIGVFETVKAFHAHVEAHWAGFKCPKCGDVSPNATLCVHRLKKDGKCDWCATGLFQSGRGIIVLEKGLKLMPIFEPIEKEGDK